MKPWVWAWNAAWRTVRGVHPALARPDDAWAEDRLAAPEWDLFRQMDPRDRDHAVRVARALLRRHPDAPDEVVRGALLHDVGKCIRDYRLGERILVHLVRAAPPPPFPLRPGLHGARQAAAHHATYGARMILDGGGSERVAELVARHEDPSGDSQAGWIREADRHT